MVMSTGEKVLEFTDLGVGLLNLLSKTNGKQRTSPSNVTANTVSTKGASEVIVDGIKVALKSFGVGNYDEAEFTKLFGQLTTSEKSDWTKLFHELETEERKALQLLIFLMAPEHEYETEEIAAVTNKDGKIEQPSKSIKRPIKKETDIRLEFMRGIIHTVNENGDNGPKIVAEMLRTNELVGSESAFKRFKETREKFIATFNLYLTKLNEKIPDRKIPVPMNLLSRFLNLMILGPKQIPEQIFQGEGWSFNPILRMLGTQIKRSKKCSRT